MIKKGIAMLLACLMLFTAACKPSENKRPEGGAVDSLTVAITKDENTLSPFTYVSGTGLTVNRLIYDTLFVADLEDRIIPWMVEEDYEAVDSKVYTLTLKTGLKFHDGDPVTAEDVKFSFEYPATQNVSGQRKVCNQIESIEVLDARTVRFTLKETNIHFLRDGFAYIRIINDATYEGVENGATVKETVGSGPYRLVEYKTGEYYKLQAVEDYFAGELRVSAINMPIMTDTTAIQQAILMGELATFTGSIGMEMVDVFESKPELKVYANAGYAPLIINFNNGEAPFDQIAFRQAISYAVDVKEICKTLYGPYALAGTKGAVRSDLPYAAAGLEYVYDPEKAIELLEDLGYTEKNRDGIRLGADGKALSFEIITYSGNAIRSRACELIKEQLKQVGIEIRILSLDMDTADAYIWPEFEVSAGRDYDLSTWGWSNTVSMTYLISLCASDFELGNYNVCGYVSERFDRLVKERLPLVKSEAQMHELLKELQAIVAEEVPLLTIGFPDTLQVCNNRQYDGWKGGAGVNVVNIFSFLGE